MNSATLPTLESLLEIQPLSHTAQLEAQNRQEQLTKPRGSLGRLEELSIQLAGILGHCKPVITGKAVVVCAGDHGVAAAGVSAYPPEVTPAMVLNFLGGGAAVSAIARAVGAKVYVLDAGVNADLPAHPQLYVRKTRKGTGHIALEPAMTRQQAIFAMLGGAEVAQIAIQDGANLLAAGDMGIGNTTPAAAITAQITGKPLRDIVGRGTGVDDAGLERKIVAVAQALVRAGEISDPLEVLAQLGGLEIAAAVGVMLQGARSRVAVVVDGFIMASAALLAVALNPQVKDYLFASHISQEKGHRIQLEHLNLEPLFDYGLRLGEGTGALLAMPTLEAAARTLTEMATFTEASVPDQESNTDLE
jgi:nicotinate-nucleotide--dimethylbenzimidazole phosphoribosyltransferase